MQLKKINIRWTDLDPNRHVSNSSLLDFMSTARIAILEEQGFGQKDLQECNLGPIVFHEHIYYFQEVPPGGFIYVGLELTGLSKDGRFFSFDQNIYDKNGNNLIGYDMIGGWMDLKERKIVPVPDEMQEQFNQIEKSPNFKTLRSEDTREPGKAPCSIDPEQL